METRLARQPLWLVALGLAVVYFATARLGLTLALPPNYKATAIWPPSGIALAALLLLGPRAWLGVWAGAFAANLWDALDPARQGSFTAHLISSAAIATGSTLQALAGAALIGRFVGPGGALNCARDAFRFAAIVPAACLIATTAGVGALGATGSVPWAAAPTVWWTWWTGDTVGALVIAPVVLCAAQCERLRRPPREAVGLFGLLIGSCIVVFGGRFPGVVAAPLAYLSLPLLVWATVRFGRRGSTLAVVVIASFAVWGTVHGTGPFVHNDVYQSLLLLDVFLAVVVVTSLVLGGLLTEREVVEGALRASETKFRQLAEALPQIVWSTAADGTTAYLNHRWTEYTGLVSDRPEDLEQVVHPDDLPRLLAAGAAAHRTGTALQDEFRLRPAKGGAYRWFLARSVPVVGAGGAPAGRLGTSTDIDDLKRTQAELQLILDTVPALIFYKDRSHRLVRVNNEFVRRMGLPREAIEGRTDSELGASHAENYRREEEELMRAGGPARTVVEPLHTPTGTRWLQTTKLPHRDAAGQVVGVLGLSVDITARKTAEEEVRRLNADLESRVAERTAELRESEERYALAVRGSQDGIWGWDLRTGAVYYSPRWKSMLGYAEGEVAGRFDEWERLLHPDDLPRAKEALGAYLGGATSEFGLEVRMRHKDGGYRWIYTRGVAQFGSDGRPYRMGGSHTDVTVRRAAEAALRESDARFRAIFDQTFQFIGLMSVDGLVLEANRTALAAAGIAEADVIGKPFWETRWWAHDAAQQGRLRDAVARAATGEMVRFEATHPAPDGSLIHVDFSLKPFRDGTGAVNLLIPEGRDITAIKRAAQELAATEALLRQFIKYAPAAIAMLDTAMRYIQASDRWVSDYKLADRDVLGRSHYEVFPDIPDRWKEIHRRVLAGAVEACAADPFPRADGRTEWLQWECRPWRAADGAIGGLIMFTQVITDQIRAAEALRESEERFRVYADHSADALFVTTADGRVVDVNRQACAALGYTRDELIGMLPNDFDPDYGAAQAAGTRARLAAGETVAFDSRHRRKDGTTFPVEVRIRPFQTATGRMKLSAVRDITERKRAELELRTSEERFRVLFEQSSDAHLIFDEFDGIIDCNRAAVDMLRCSDKGALLALHPAVLSPEFQPDGRRSLEKCVEMDATARRDGYHRFDWAHRRMDGEVFPCEVTLTPVALAGRSALLVVWHDLTERKRTEEALRESEERFRTAFDHAPIGLALVSTEGRWLKVNQELCQMLGYSTAELLATDFQTITHPDDLNADLALVGEMLTGVRTGYQMEKRYFHKTGRELHALLAVALVRGQQGEPLYFVSQIKDITERKLAEESMRVSEERLRMALRGARAGVWECTLPDWGSYWSPEYRELYGFTADEQAHTDKWRNRVHPDDLLQIEANLAALAEPGRDAWQQEFRLVVPGHEVRWVLDFVRVIRAADGHPVGVGGVNIDITARKLAERELRTNEERYRTVVQALAEGVVVQDRDGAIVTHNDRAAEILGLTHEQLTGRTSLDPRWRAVREDDSPFPGAEHPAMVVLRTGQAQFNTIMGVHTPEGELRWISINAVPLPGPIGSAVVCSFQDVTAVRKANDRLRASVREKEVMLKEIHHRVKNNLQIISTLLELQMDGLTEPAAVAAFRESRGRVRSMSLIHERLYRSENLASVEFGPYVRGLAEDLFRAYRADDEAIQLEVAVSAPALPLDVAVPCGLLVNELISNCLKYAFAGRGDGIIAVALDRAENGAFVLTVADNGVGLPPGFDLRNTPSFGLQLVGTLVAQLRGAVELGSGPGTRFAVRFTPRE